MTLLINPIWIPSPVILAVLYFWRTTLIMGNFFNSLLSLGFPNDVKTYSSQANFFHYKFICWVFYCIVFFCPFYWSVWFLYSNFFKMILFFLSPQPHSPQSIHLLYFLWDVRSSWWVLELFLLKNSILGFPFSFIFVPSYLRKDYLSTFFLINFFGVFFPTLLGC